MAQQRNGACDLCLGSDSEQYLALTHCGRELIKCRGCGLVTALPGGAPSSEEPATVRDRRADLRRAAAVMKILPSGRILEVGCGKGYFLAGLDPARYQVVGVEPAEDKAADARRHLEAAGLKGAVVQGSLAEAKLPSEAFDMVVLFGTIGSAASPRATLMEASRLLRSGGYAVIETPSLGSLTARLCGSRWQPLRDPHADYFFTPGTLERLAATCGLAGGTSRLPMPVGWPPPGTLVYVTRKSGVALKMPALGDLAPKVGNMSPMGATR